MITLTYYSVEPDRPSPEAFGQQVRHHDGGGDWTIRLEMSADAAGVAKILDALDAAVGVRIKPPLELCAARSLPPGPVEAEFEEE